MYELNGVRMRWDLTECVWLGVDYGNCVSKLSSIRQGDLTSSKVRGW